MSHVSFEDRTQALLKSLRDAGTYKELRHISGPMGATVTLEDRGEVICLCSNNYLGLSNHPEVVQAAHDGLKQYAAGTASVRFICGTFAFHREVEETIAEFTATEAALTYVSCWCANEALIGTVVGRNDAIFSDELNHASIIDGCRLSRPLERMVYAHRDGADLETKLKANMDADARWVITDGVFSMEGAVANLAELVDLCKRYDARLIVDDSHGVGVLGRTGRGTPEHCDVLGQVDVITGTLGKALGGAAGGYVAGSRDLIDLLVQRSRPSLFSNALPPTVACSAKRAIELVQRDTVLVDRLRANIARIRTGLADLGFECQESPTAIIPIMIGDEAEAIRKSERLLELGVWVVAFGYPVVPKGKARLRVQVSAALTDEQVDQVLDAFGGV
ncbi:MAG: glycine C-acetyltransferase [Verrucomicrobia bacterium]|jgi:glycine C-acetyltransferase|nr:glycine C-acetyltransferase [Verrucomicrobiota bacterium]